MKQLFTLFAFTVFININAQVCFNPAVNYSEPTNPCSIISADFDLDGQLDLAITNMATANVSVRFGTGTGSFGAPTNFPVSPNPFSIIAADFNGDTKLDFAVTHITSPTISILLGTGTASFGVVTTFTVGPSPYSLVSGDFNGDSKIDLAVSNAGSNNVSVLLGTGTGSFGATTNFTVGSVPRWITSGYFNADANLDLVTANNGTGANSVSILLGTGTGSFGAPVNFSTGAGTNPAYVISADLNGDSKADLATANRGFGSNNVSVLLGTGTGSFGTANTFSVANGPNAVISADFNGDSKPDLAAINGNSFDASILIGNGSGSFATAINYAVDANPISMVSGDFDGDTKTDIAVANNGSSKISILLNCTVLGIENFSNAQEFLIFPNPASGRFTIKNVKPFDIKLELRNILGSIVIENRMISAASNTSIDITNLSKGLYFVSFTDEKGNRSDSKLIVE